MTLSTTLLYTLAALLTALQLVDGWTTYQIIKGGGVERNRLIAALMDELGVYPALVAVKVLAAGLAWAVVLLPGSATTEHRIAGLVGLAVFYGWVAIHNWQELQEQKRKDVP